MLSAYRVGYVTGRLVTRGIKFYLGGKFINATSSKVAILAKNHKIDSNNTKIVTENVFDCLEYLD